MSNNKFYFYITSVIVLAIVILSLATIISFHIKHMSMIENNWTRGTIQGYDYPTWYKEIDKK